MKQRAQAQVRDATLVGTLRLVGLYLGPSCFLEAHPATRPTDPSCFINGVATGAWGRSSKAAEQLDRNQREDVASTSEREVDGTKSPTQVAQKKVEEEDKDQEEENKELFIE